MGNFSDLTCHTYSSQHFISRLFSYDGPHSILVSGPEPCSGGKNSRSYGGREISYERLLKIATGLWSSIARDCKVRRLWIQHATRCCSSFQARDLLHSGTAHSRFEDRESQLLLRRLYSLRDSRAISFTFLLGITESLQSV